MCIVIICVLRYLMNVAEIVDNVVVVVVVVLMITLILSEDPNDQKE